ncbi:MAG: DegT/DnrJ/EryC1/StrS family aminotransferase [Lachnospiraceae bacterium]|nr:DegT/DnrJ/EryC1/StrS family aminotransferase [Lachnospiraceae bacterium]
MEFINQMEPSFDENERIALSEYMASGGWVTEFKKTREFEKMIASYTGAKYCSVVSNGTLSLVVALIACGIGVGDEVLVPDYTMVATANAAELIGAKTVFVDIDRDNLCMDIEKMKAAVTKRTKAIILVSINGRCPKNIEQFVQYCEEHNIELIEDAAQSLGSFWQGRHLGRFGRVGSFSFSAPKIITTGQGGALITDDEEIFNKITKIRDFGRLSGGSDHYLTKGWNFKFTDIQAVIGIEQMKKLPERVEKKKEMAKWYAENLQGVHGVELIQTDLAETTPWFFDILCERREDLISFLKENGIGSRPFYPALHAEPAYGYEGEYPIAVEVATKGLWLPSTVTLNQDTIKYVCEKIREFYA